MNLKQSYIVVLVLSIVLIACNSPSQPASAHTKGGFHDDPVKVAHAPLIYDTMSASSRHMIAQLDAFYKNQVRAGFNGAVLVGYKGKVIYERYYGYGNKERKIPTAFNSSCQLASVSKTFTGIATLYLHEQKKINIDYPIQHYIKDFPYPNISLKMLLSHRSGLPDYTKWVPVYNHNTRTPISNEEMVKLLVKHKPRLEFKPNTKFRYSNTNYALLARIIELETGMSFRDFMSKYIFEPLGMHNTFVYQPQFGFPGNATISYKYNWIREPDMFADGVTGDKGIYSTAQDMFRWDQSLYNSSLLSHDMIEYSYGPCSNEKPGIKNYGLGWRMLCYPNGNKVIYHNGWWHGNNTSFYRLIKENMTIIVLGNRFNKTIYKHAPSIYNIVKGAEAANGFDEEG